MSSRQKQQGTRWETLRARSWRALGLHADRHPLKGRDDTNDVWISHPVDGWSEQDKAVEQLNIHKCVEGAVAKAGHLRTLVAWKRLPPKKDGQSRRRTDTLPAIVACHPKTAAVLLLAYEELRARDPEAARALWQQVDEPDSGQ